MDFGFLFLNENVFVGLGILTLGSQLMALLVAWLEGLCHLGGL